MPDRFHADEITVEFDTPPLLEKKPPCPDRFTWLGCTYEVAELLTEWHDFQRRGRMARNMRPTNLAQARQRGSWGVGRFHFRVRVTTGGVFEIYYDRAPQGSDDRKGTWVLSREEIPD
jgi:hypothetical protein